MKLQHGLAGLLVTQILIAGGLFWSGQASQYAATPQALASFDQAAVDKILVADKEQDVVIKKIDGKWQLPDLHNLPVNEKLITDLLEKLNTESIKWPVTNTASSHERFQVADKEFQRHLTLFSENKSIAELYLGTSPGFRKIHVRRADEKEVYTAELNVYEIPTAEKEWLDQYLISAKGLQSITGPDYALQKSGDSWSFAKTSTDPENSPANSSSGPAAVDVEKAKELVAALSNLTITNVAEVKPDGEAVIIDVKSDSSELRYEFIKSDDKYYVKRSDNDLVFTLSQYEYDRIAGVRQTQLALKPEEKSDTEDVSEKSTNG